MPRLTLAIRTLSRLSSERCLVIGFCDLPRDDGDETRLQISHPCPTSIPSCTSLRPLQCPSSSKNSIPQKVLGIFSFFPPSPSASQLQPRERTLLAMETVDGDGYSHSTH